DGRGPPPASAAARPSRTAHTSCGSVRLRLCSWLVLRGQYSGYSRQAVLSAPPLHLPETASLPTVSAPARATQQRPDPLTESPNPPRSLSFPPPFGRRRKRRQGFAAANLLRGSIVKRTACLLVVLVLLPTASARASGWCREGDLDRANRRLHGYLVDYTHNHGFDRRIWSEALGQKRDLYVYLPPGFDPGKCYPLMIWLHGFAQDEQSFLLYVVQLLDQAMASGKLPPMIIAAPDGSLNGDPCLITAGSFFLDSDAGRFEQFLMHDVWNFLFAHYPIRPEPEAHVLAGVSMGGGGAFNMGIKYRDRVKVVIGIFPPLN